MMQREVQKLVKFSTCATEAMLLLRSKKSEEDWGRDDEFEATAGKPLTKYDNVALHQLFFMNELRLKLSVFLR